MTDLELIESALQGNEQAFEQIVKRYEKQVAATVIGMLGKTDVADDIGQEVFIRFYKGMHKFHGAAGLGTYLTRIAINLSINELKRRKRRFRIFSRPEDDSRTEPAGRSDEDLTAFEQKDMVRQAIQNLPPKFRAVVVLRLIEGRSTEETARLLNVPVGTVLSRLARAQKKLRKELLPFMQEEI